MRAGSREPLFLDSRAHSVDILFKKEDIKFNTNLIPFHDKNTKIDNHELYPFSIIYLKKKKINQV